jgi:hypothetical protein
VPVVPSEVGAIHAKEREQMRAGLRLGIAIAAAGLALGPVPLFAQEAPPEATTSTPAADSVGPRELQNFNLQGTVTRAAEQPQAPPATPAPQRAQTATARTVQPSDQLAGTAAQTPRAQDAQPTTDSSRSAATEPARSAPTRTSSVTLDLPPINESPAASPTRTSYSAPSPDSSVAEAESSAGSLAPQRSFPVIPWLLAAIALGAGGAFLFWRNRSREAFAGGPHFDAYVAPEPVPRPRPAPAPAPAPAPKAPPPPAGIVSTRLRPWLELAFEPVRCVLDEEKVTFEFEIGLFNSGSAPARDVLIEATLLNAGPNQYGEVAAFFARPVGQGQRIAAIPPLQRMSLRTQVSAPRNQMQIFQAGGRQVIVPLIAFNTLYRWGVVSEGQTSASFLLGRDTKGEKLAPFHVDLGPRVFRGLGVRALPQSVRK